MSESTRIGEAATREQLIAAAAKLGSPPVQSNGQSEVISFGDQLNADLSAGQTGVLALSPASKKTPLAAMVAISTKGVGQKSETMKATPVITKSVPTVEVRDALDKINKTPGDNSTAMVSAKNPIETPVSSKVVDAEKLEKSDPATNLSGKYLENISNIVTRTSTHILDSSTHHASAKTKSSDMPGSSIVTPANIAPEAGANPDPLVPVLATMPLAVLPKSNVSRQLPEEVFCVKTAGSKSEVKAAARPLIEPLRMNLVVASPEPSTNNTTSREASFTTGGGSVLQGIPISPLTMSEGMQHALGQGLVIGSHAPAHASMQFANPNLSAEQALRSTSLLLSTQGGEPVSASEARTLIATPHVLEIGIASDTHGWLRVRAELGKTGELNGTVVANSVSGVSALRGELPAMFSFLRGEEIGVNSLVIQSAAKSSDELEFGQSTASGGQPQQGSHKEEERTNAKPQSSTEQTDALRVGMPSSSTSKIAGKIFAAAHVISSGGWLSVRV